MLMRANISAILEKNKQKKLKQIFRPNLSVASQIKIRQELAKNKQTNKQKIIRKTERKFLLEIFWVPDALCRIAKPVVPLLSKYYSPVPTETISF